MINEKICVIMCIYRRIDRLKYTLHLLSQQSDKNFDFFIWNNSASQDEVKKTFEEYSFFKGYHHSGFNIGGIGRFYYANILKDFYTKIIFIDDDQIFNNFMIEDFRSSYLENSIVSWWAWKIEKDYFDRIRIENNKDEVNYCGTGGMILPSKIFKHKEVFKIPFEYLFVEDLWLSLVAIKKGYSLHGCNVNLAIINDGKDQSIDSNLLESKNDLYKKFEDIYTSLHLSKSKNLSDIHSYLHKHKKMLYLL